jgi:hypothetical protein
VTFKSAAEVVIFKRSEASSIRGPAILPASKSVYVSVATAKVGETTTVPTPNGEKEQLTETEVPEGLDTIMDFIIAVVAVGTVRTVAVAAPVETKVYRLYEFAINFQRTKTLPGPYPPL